MVHAQRKIPKNVTTPVEMEVKSLRTGGFGLWAGEYEGVSERKSFSGI